MKKIFLGSFLVFFLSPLFFTRAAVPITGAIPEIESARAFGISFYATDPASISEYITRVYQFGIGISGIVAVGMIVAGAVMISASAGREDRQREGKDMITSALWGIVLLFGAYLILKTINPGLILLREPNAPKAETIIYNISDFPTASNPNLVPLPQNIPTNENACRSGSTCLVDKELIPFLNNLLTTASKRGAGAWYVTEAYPPTIPHLSLCHNKGTCVDIALQDKNASCDTVQKFLRAIYAAGFDMVNEYSKCPDTDPPPKTYDTTTGQNVHVFYNPNS